ncbi:unnamed protein product [Caenorhabditis angaria]|uniref:G-protein coupled receptors family 1 profile domain-containing protein n=1 Tax=Caenorhabditis angaria TaxID=860376 RepID=A0A9P1IN22_9PELO|nr:unnamed protein product [Caenorhabditis angaria]
MSFAFNMYLYLGEGFTILVTNSILLWCILSDSKNRQRREFILVAAQSIADLFYAIAFMLIAHLRLGIYHENRLNATVPTSECAFIPALWLHNIATPLLGLIPMTTSFNFLICSVVPLWYMKAGHVYTTMLLSVPTLITISLVFSNFYLQLGKTVEIAAICVAANGAAHHIIYQIMILFRILANLGSAVIYAFILAYLKRNKGDSLKKLSKQQIKTHRNAKITLGMVTGNSMILLFIPDVLIFFNPLNILKNYSTPLYSMTLSKTTINFIVYICRYRELRNIILLKILGIIPKKWSSHVQVKLFTQNEKSTTRAITEKSFGSKIAPASPMQQIGPREHLPKVTVAANRV